jgi:hypothetical protein
MFLLIESFIPLIGGRENFRGHDFIAMARITNGTIEPENESLLPISQSTPLDNQLNLINVA